MEQPVPDPEVPAVRASTDRILTTHAGSLPRTPALLEANAARQAGAQPDGFTDLLRDEVSELVQRQLAVGIDVVGDGEYGKAMSSPVDRSEERRVGEECGGRGGRVGAKNRQ